MPKTVLITGATSGFGKAIAWQFATNGWKVIALGRRQSRLDQLVEAFSPGQIYPMCQDLCQSMRVKEALDLRPDRFSPINVLINNAGLALGTSPAPECQIEDWHQMIKTNIIGLVDLTHYLLAEIISERGIIINMSSIAANYPYPGGNIYCATKAFVSHFTQCLRSDLHGTGVRVTAVEPGIAETEFTLVRTKGDQAASDKLYRHANPITSEDIAMTAYWIASLPSHLNINRLEMMPVSQSYAGFQVARDPDK